MVTQLSKKKWAVTKISNKTLQHGMECVHGNQGYVNTESAT